MPKVLTLTLKIDENRLGLASKLTKAACPEFEEPEFSSQQHSSSNQASNRFK